jgi:CelD/BcsL family acetyltransferase involved in cellulose biosynthesis
MPRLRITIARTAAEVDALVPLWNELLACQGHTIFQRFEWNQLALLSFQDRLAAHVVCVESESGAVILPTAVNYSSGQLELIGETLFDYRDVLHVGDVSLLRLAWEQCAALGRSFRAVAIQDYASQERWADFPLHPFANAPCVNRDLVSEEKFRRAHPRAARLYRKLEGIGTRLRVVSGEQVDPLRDLYVRKSAQGTSGGDNLFRDPQRQNFLTSIAAREGNACQIFALYSKEDALIAGIVTFRDGSVRRFYTTYFNSAWAKYSPGVALLYEATARSLGQGFSCDFMTGDYAYKLRFANSSCPLYQVAVTADHLRTIATGGRPSHAA